MMRFVSTSMKWKCLPDINLAHADLNKYNQVPNHLANHLLRDFVFRSKVAESYIYNTLLYR